jgi:ferrous iron transport protein A
MTTLDQLHVGQRARIESLRGADGLAQRMSEMGLLEGEEVEVVGFAPLGDPMEIRLQDYRLSLRRTEAARVAVSPLP